MRMPSLPITTNCQFPKPYSLVANLTIYTCLEAPPLWVWSYFTAFHTYVLVTKATTHYQIELMDNSNATTNGHTRTRN